jgi:DNA adenine methylase
MDNSLEENIFPKLAEQSARFIYLLNFGYNGLCRFNKQGKFNVPYGKQSPNIDPIVNNLVKIHNYLNSVDLVITNTSYSQVDTEFDLSSSFFYLDPPYDQTFNSYWNDSVFDQVQLFNWINHSLNKAKWLMTNSGTDLIRELYRDYEIIDLSSFRCVGATKESRVKVNDVIIRNYKD